MGAEWFETTITAPTAEEALARVANYAKHEYGHRDYTGTIAEKDEVRVVPTPPQLVGKELRSDYVVRYWLNGAMEDPEFGDKWGPAFAIDLGPASNGNGRRWLLFGWASS